jgi:magnesium transporter
MQRDLIAVPEHWTVGRSSIISLGRGAADRLLGSLCRRSGAQAGRHDPAELDPSHAAQFRVADLMQREQTLIPVDMDQEEVALRFQKYALISAAVVDASGRLVGMITVDDIVHIIQEEASEDALLLSGVDEGDINEPVVDSYKSRVRWLLANLITALVAATIISLFEETIERMVALAALMPIVAGVGGNAGTQTLAVTVRALATNQLTQSNTVRAIVREIRVAVLNGLTVALVIGIAVTLFFGNGMLGGVIAAAMLVNIVIAGLAGVLVPLGLDRAGADPAVASSVFVTMVTDSMGFFVFLGLASASGLVG